MTKMKRKLVLVLAVIVAAGALFIASEKLGVTNFIHTKPAPSGPTPEQLQAESTVNSDNKQKFIEDSSKPTTETSNSNTSQSNQTSSIELTPRQETNGTVTIITKLYSINSGSCTLTVTNGTKSDIQTANIVYQPEYSTCAGFSEPISKVGVGNWTIKLVANSNGQSYEKTVTFTVQ